MLFFQPLSCALALHQHFQYLLLFPKQTAGIIFCSFHICRRDKILIKAVELQADVSHYPVYLQNQKEG